MFRFDRPTVVALGLWVALWVAFAIIVPNAAGAADRVARAQAVAERVFPASNCAGHTVAQWSMPDARMPADVGGWVFDGGGCTVHLARTNPELRYYDVLCTVMLHEYGHLAGLEHSDNPRSVMFPAPQVDRRCARA